MSPLLELASWEVDSQQPARPAGDHDLSWHAQAACQGKDTAIFFPEGAGRATAAAREAKAICATCAVSAECLAYAIAEGVDGIWGGTTWHERRDMTRPRNGQHQPTQVPLLIRRLIRRRYGCGESARKLADEFGVARRTVLRIVAEPEEVATS